MKTLLSAILSVLCCTALCASTPVAKFTFSASPPQTNSQGRVSTSAPPRQLSAGQGTNQNSARFVSPLYSEYSEGVSTVIVVATDPEAARGPTPDNGAFTITRLDGDWSSPLTVQFSIGGTALAGSDYQTITASATIPANAASTQITVVPSAQSGSVHEASVTLALQPDEQGSYNIGLPETAAVSIYDPSVTAPAAVAVPSGLVAWWPGESNPWDANGGGKATALGALGYSRCEVGQGFSIEGSGSGAWIGYATALDLQNFTIEAWIRRGDPNFVSWDTWAEALIFGGSWGGYGFGLANDGRLTLSRIGYSGVYSASAITDTDTFHHVAVTKTGSSVIFYLDGTAETADAYDPGFGAGGVYAVGASGDYCWNAFLGKADDVAVYNRALSPAEIQAIHNAAWSGKCLAPVIFEQPQSLAAAAGDSVNFSVAVAGTPQLSYQWGLDGNSLAGKTNSSLTLPAAQAADAGQYSVTIANSLGTVTSSDAALTVTPPSPCVPAPSGLVAWWAAENNALDWAGTNHGAIVGGVGFTRGRVGTAFSITNDYSGVGIGHPDGLQVQDFTIEAWIKRADPSLVSFASGEDSLFLSCGWYGYGFGLASSGQPLLTKIGVDARTPDTSISDTAWHHVAITKSGSTVIFYVDGVAYATDPYETIFDLGSDMAIGARGGDFWNAFNGLIDEVSFYSRPLADTEIQAIYAAGRTGKCPDADGSGMPSWWQLKYFGQHVDPSGDFDGDNHSNLQEYQNGRDPNTIKFSVNVPQNPTASTVAIGTIKVLGGVPSQMAVLVNTTNLVATNWVPFTGGFTAGLGPSDGTYNVWIVLKGMAPDSEQTWDLTRIVLDRAGPTLYITNPVSHTISYPMMQLQGYSSEPLSKIEYDMANSSGTLTNQRGTVTGQYYDPALHAFTTNFFACLDIDLAPGENTIILRGTDLAGNVTTGTLVYNLVSSTNVPVLALRWPQNGQTVCNGQITIDGWLDNFTARISAGIVDASGASNAFTGVVERNGHFWLEDLPLADGTNLVTLTASNVWAKVATTNFYVVKTGFVLTINPIAEDGQLFQPTIPVGGTVGDAGYTVWVNGRQASLEGNTWQVTAAPVNAGGSASFTVTAYPPGQNPTTDPENPDTNPANPGAPSDKLTVDKPMRRFIQNYHQQTTRTSHTYYSCPDGIGGIAAWADGWNTEASTCEWTDGPDGGGTESDSNSGSGTGCVGPNCWSGSDLCTSVSVWPGSTWPVFAEGVRTTDGTCDGTPTHTVTSASDPPVIQEHCAVSVGECYNWFTPWDGCSGSWSGQFERTADVNLLLYTGGKAVPKRQSLFSVSAKATEITEALDYSLFRSTGTEAIPPEDTSVGDFGKLGNDALAYATLAGDTTANISVKTSRKYYTSIATPRKLDLEVRSVSLLGIRTILRDNGEGPYGAPHWSTNETTGAVASYPVLYVSGDQVRASTQFKLTGDGGFPVIVKGTVSGGATAFTLWGTNDSPGGPTCGFDTYADIPLTTNLVDSFKPMAISWQYSAKDKLEFVDAGKSTNWVYVSLRQPSATLYHTVVHLACSVPGATSDGQAVDNTWNQFTGKGVNSWDGRPLHYYRSNSWMLTPTSLEGLLQARNGNCYAWGLLLYEAFGVNGILSTNVLVTATNSLYFLVKAWDFGAQAYQDEQVFKWQLTTRYNNSNQDPTMVPPPYATSGNLYGLMTSLSSIPGQHTQPPSEKFFVWHRILLWNGTYYDPSYGETYSGEANFESKAVEGFAMLDYHIQGNCSVWKVRKPNGTNSIVFTRQ